MITHTFICDNCGTIVEDITTVGIHKCSTCGNGMRWNLKGLSIHGNYDHPVHSDSLAINPNQRAEHERLFPNIQLDKQNRPIFDNFMDHENYLKKTGFRKLRQKIKVKGKRIASL